MPDILHFVKIHASPEREYEATKTPEGIRNWWTRDADLDSEVGGAGEFRFLSYGPGYVTRIRIEELKSPSHVGWTTVSSFRPEWSGTSMSFDLREDGGDTVLLFAHRN